MGHGLHKLGQFAFKRPWIFITTWLVILALLGGLAAKFMTPASSAVTIPGTQAQKAIDRVNELFPKNGKGSARIVFEAKNGKKLSDFRSQIDALTTRIAKVDGITSATNPFSVDGLISKDGTIGYIPVGMKEEQGSVAKQTYSGVNKAIERVKSSDLAIEQGGGVIDNVPGEILGVGEVGGLVIALVVLIVTLGALLAAGMPVISALVGVGVGTAGLFAASHFFTMSSTTPVLGVMLGLAVGIDYSLFIINKYRLLVLDGVRPNAAIGRALGTAGNAVVFAAITVIIALAALSVVQIPFMTTMGLAGAGSILAAALVALTLVPSMLGLAGNKVFRRKNRQKVAKNETHEITQTTTFWQKWGNVLVAHPWPILIASVIVIAAIAWPVKDLKMGLPSDEYAAQSTTQRKAYELISKGFGPGYNGPLLVVAEKLPAVSEADRQKIRSVAEAELNQKVAAMKQAQEAQFAAMAQSAVTPEQQYELQQQIQAAQAAGAEQLAAANAQIDEVVAQNAKFVQLKAVADNIAKQSDVETALPVAATDNGTAGLIQVIPKSAPNDQKTNDLIADLRKQSTISAVTDRNGATLEVTGAIALQRDINQKLADALPEYLAVVVGLSLLILLVAFRSILVPIKATLGFVLSVLASFGAMVAVFQWGWFGITDAPGPLVSFIPIITIGILFGLAMDYEFFLVSGMHEAYAHTKNAKKAVARGFGAGSKVVTAAAVIMISVFGGFISNHDATIRMMGFGLAVGILVDAFLVRMTIVPALMTILGKSAWWLPGWLDKLLPHVSIEGEEETSAK